MEPFAASPPPGGVEAAVVRRAQRGDPAALDAVVDALLPYVGRICGAIALDAGDDALQEAMMAIVGNLASLREPEALRGWARRIAVRESLRVVGAQRALPIDPVELDATASLTDPTTGVDVRAVLADLAPQQRAVLVLRHVDGLGEAEMAEALAVAPGTVKSRLHRAGAAFRARWSS